MITLHNPDTVVAPASFYSQAAEVGPGKRWLHISGQVGAAPDGTWRKASRPRAIRSGATSRPCSPPPT